MPRRTLVFVLFAILAAAAFVRLGFWQLHRLSERRAQNAALIGRLSQPTIDLARLPADSDLRYRRARITGSPDYAHELVLTNRSHDGSPGVNLLTPVRVPGRDTAIVVDRGWVYAPDGSTVDLSRWHESDSTFVGYVGLIPEREGSGSATLGGRPRLLRRFDRAALAQALPYPAAPVFLIALVPDSSRPIPQQVARIGVPPLDEGPHLSYAIQWFAFAAIALAGAGIVVARGRLREEDIVPVPPAPEIPGMTPRRER